MCINRHSPSPSATPEIAAGGEIRSRKPAPTPALCPTRPFDPTPKVSTNQREDTLGWLHISTALFPKVLLSTLALQDKTVPSTHPPPSIQSVETSHQASQPQTAASHTHPSTPESPAKNIVHECAAGPKTPSNSCPIFLVSLSRRISSTYKTSVPTCRFSNFYPFSGKFPVDSARKCAGNIISLHTRFLQKNPQPYAPLS